MAGGKVRLMAFSDLILTRLVEEPRDRAVSAILRAMARAIEAGAEVAPEPERRDAARRVVRAGPLDLPRRADFAIASGGRTLFCRVEAEAPEAGEAVTASVDDAFFAEIAPFAWDALRIRLQGGPTQPDWRPLRRWFLEWFQSRHADLAPELLGAVHTFDGPTRTAAGWAFTIDLGSAPPAALRELLVALSETGATRVRLG